MIMRMCVTLLLNLNDLDCYFDYITHIDWKPLDLDTFYWRSVNRNGNKQILIIYRNVFAFFFLLCSFYNFDYIYYLVAVSIIIKFLCVCVCVCLYDMMKECRWQEWRKNIRTMTMINLGNSLFTMINNTR